MQNLPSDYKKATAHEEMKAYSERFDLFCKLYPKRVGRLLGKFKTYEYFKKLSDEDQLLCCRAAGAYAQYYMRPLKPEEFRPAPRDPERFLRKDWWRDWLEPQTTQCAFRSVAFPCQEIALPGETHCKVHKELIAMLKRQRERSTS